MCAAFSAGASVPAVDTNRILPPKVTHAEPLYIDLIRDLGARRGEQEWNVAWDLTDRLSYDRYRVLIEYEWAVADYLGLEVEVPATIYTSNSIADPGDAPQPSNRIESVKTAVQWTALVDADLSLSLALGYINELEFSDLDVIRNGPVLNGNIFNPFLVVAKRWGESFHSLLYTGPRTLLHFDDGSLTHRLEANLSLHYMINDTRNFIGVETNAVVTETNWSATIRPQMRLGFSEHVLIGLGVGLPVSRKEERLSMFMRLIWEP